MSGLSLDRRIRRLAIAGRLALLGGVVLLAALAVAGVGWSAVRLADSGFDTVRQEQARTAALLDLTLRASRIEARIHHYFAAPDDDLLKQTTQAAEDLLLAIGTATGPETEAGDEAAAAVQAAARRFFAAFQELKRLDAELAALFESRIAPVLDEMSARYVLLEAGLPGRGGAVLTPTVSQSHQAFVAALVAVEAQARDDTPDHAQQVRRRLARLVESFTPLGRSVAHDLDRDGVATLRARTDQLAAAVEALIHDQAERRRLLSRELVPSQEMLSSALERLIAASREREALRLRRGHEQLAAVTLAGALGAGALLLLAGGIGVLIVRSLRRPLIEIREMLEAGRGGDWSREIPLEDGPDEVAALARTVRGFRQDVLDQRQAEAERAEADRRAVEARHRLLGEVLERVEAHSAAGLLLPPGLSSDAEAVAIAAALGRILARARAAIAARDADLAALTLAREAAEATARDRSDLLLALIGALRGPLQRGEPVFPLLEWIEATLDYGRLDRGDHPLEPVAAEPETVILSALAVARAGGGGDPARLTAWVDPGLPRHCRLDPTRLSRLIGLLIDQAASPGGWVRLAAERLEGDGPPLLRLWGVGEGDPAAPAPSALGRLLARLLAERLGGRLDDLAGPAGTVALWCDLPLDPLPATASAPVPAAGALMGARVLVVAPDAEERRLAAQVAEQAGAAVVRVPGGREAIAAAAKANHCRAPFDLVVAAAAALAPDHLGALGTAPLLLLEDATTPPARRAALQASPGWVGVLGRPLAADQVLSAMARVVTASSHGRQQGCFLIPS